ncbi:DUF262 domain-containing protein [Mucilaginibacter sp. R-33]|uniref:DUF262 domain-containing protein n=1 Tax=Mucilaginibacter sp. R-33 TaxID=3416711 RepID=UPI003CF70171
MSDIIEKFLESQNRLVTQSSDLSLDSIASMVDSGAIDVSPGYQRRERWSIEKESALIESFILNIPVPPIYLAEDEYGKYTVIDGKQRVTAIYKFMKTDQKLKKLERFTELENFTLSNLPSQLKNALTIRPYIRVVTLLNQSDPNLKYEVFTRLNTGGDNLLSQEVRNVAFRGPLNDLIFELSANEFLRRQLKIVTKNEKVYKEMVDAEYVLRFFTIRCYWNNFPGNMNIAMNNFMNEFRFAENNYIEEFRQLFNSAMNICQRIWGDNAFHRPAGEDYRRLMLQGFYDVQMVPISFYLNREFSDGQIGNIREAFYDLYANDDEFQDSIRQFTSNSQRVSYRIGKMRELIERILA